MKPLKWIAAFCIGLSLLLSPVTPVQAGDGGTQDGNKPLCLPGAYPGDPQDCLALGPSQPISELARAGVPYPPRPLPAYSPDPTLSNIPVLIAKINLDAKEPVPLYATFENAVAGENPVSSIAPGALRYVSYMHVQYANDKPYVQLLSGQWVRASLIGYSHFQGLLFTKTPSNSFGWIIDQAEVYSAPGYGSAKTGKTLYKETPVQIYQIEAADKTDWYMIGLGEWVERRFIRQVRINTTPPQGVTGNRWIEVNLYDQTLSVYENNQLVFATLIASGGEPFYTRPGLFNIYKKKDVETMSGAFEADRSDYYLLQDVPWTMYFDQARALHGAYWRMWFGYPGTHGCVNLSMGDSNWLFHWANEGDPVYVWDPSGETPVDPELYTAGGA